MGDKAEEKKKNAPWKWLRAIDQSPLFLAGLLLWTVLIVLYVRFGENVVFDIHDQLDETICSYVLPARHLFTGASSYSEMMCELPAESLRSSAPLFVPLYRIFTVEWAFLIQFFIESLTAFCGMYFLCKKISKSSIAALASAVLFSLLPFQPVYGLNIIGSPLLFLCFYTLYSLPDEEHKAGKGIASFFGILYFVLTTHIALSGYVALLLFFVSVICVLIKDKGVKKERLPYYLGAVFLALSYAVLNAKLLLGLVIGNSGFISHREDFVSPGAEGNFLGRVWTLFFYGEERYAPSLHRYILPVLILLSVYAVIRYRRADEKIKKAIRIVPVLWGAILVICILSTILGSQAFADFQNSSQGFLRHVQLDRLYYFLPAFWWILTGLLVGIFLADDSKIPQIAKVLLVILAFVPTLFLFKPRLNLYDNINYRNHGSAFTGKQSMKEYYDEDVMAEIDAYIGRDKSTYRVAHIGLSPAPSLVHGFYTADGYSNNYPKEYKTAFRKVIAPVLDSNEQLRVYYDQWGSRVYLFLDEGMSDGEKYTNLPYDFEALKGLGCEYIFADKEITDTPGLTFEKSFVSAVSNSEIWLYRIGEKTENEE